MTKQTVTYLSFRDTDGKRHAAKSTKPLHELSQSELVNMIYEGLGVQVEGVVLVEVMNEDSSGDIIEEGV